MLHDLERRFVRTQILLLGFFVWGVGFLYLISTVLFNSVQTRWELICFTWEAGVFGVPLIVFRPMLRTIKGYARQLESGTLLPPEQVALYQRKVLAYPLKVAVEVFCVSLMAYTLGALQMRYFAELPWEHVALSLICGLICALLWGTVEYFLLEYDMRPLTELALAANHGMPPPAMHVSLRVKIFLCSLSLVVASLGFFGVLAYTRAVRIVEEENGSRLTGRVEELASLIGALPPPVSGRLSDAWWMLANEFSVSPRGYLHVVGPDGTILATHPSNVVHGPRLADERLLPSVRQRVLTETHGHLTDQVHETKIVSFGVIPGSDLRLVAIAPLRDFSPQLDQLVYAGLAGMAFALLLSLGTGFLCTRSITTSLAAVTRAAQAVAERRDLSQRVNFMTNDEVGVLGYSFNQMAQRLQTYAEGLEQLVTERTRALEERSRQLEAKNAELGDFLYIASHDLRAPLINLAGFSRALQESIATLNNGAENHCLSAQWSDLKADIDESLQFILHSTAKMDMLVNSLLELSRIDRRTATPQTIDTAKLVADVLDAFRFQIAEKEITVHTGQLPAIVGDPVRVNQVFSNLVDNAIKYMPAKPGARIDIGCEQEPAHYRFFVRDTGVGIRREDQDKIFRLFTRVGAHGIAGDGVGLAAVRKILEKHGGRIWVQSQVGVGSTFYFTVPRPPREDASAMHVAAPNRLDTPAVIAPPLA